MVVEGVLVVVGSEIDSRWEYVIVEGTSFRGMWLRRLVEG